MRFIISLLILALLQTLSVHGLYSIEDANPVGKYFFRFPTGSALMTYIKEGNTVYVVYRCPNSGNSLAGPYSLRSAPGYNAYVIEDDLSPGRGLYDLIGNHCYDFVLEDGDLLNLTFNPDDDALTTSLVNKTISFARIHNSLLNPYYSTYLGLNIEFYVYEKEEVQVTVKCGASEVSAVLFFEPDRNHHPLPLVRYVIGPDQIGFYDRFKDEPVWTDCAVELSPNDFETMAYATPTTAYTELGGKRLTLTAL
ncbi:hypothetical protein FOZ63_022564 [Perkinsus olseni]|uniref:Uncharacterized protein n=1 Tax=Perkinsus olseni TaxID=32597 RepID=A0A7J6RMD2_PEROL|nr:hypothetical protein FOZ63_022564 [Perkinsus olseni]